MDSQLNQALDWIDKYLESLADSELPSAYDAQRRDFFSFLKLYNCNIGAIVNLLKQYCKGKTLEQIKTANDAIQLRDILMRMLSSEAFTRRKRSYELKDPGKWAYKNIAYCFDQAKEPPNA